MVEGVSVSVNAVGSLRQMWYDVVRKKKMDAAWIFDLGDGQSGQSGYLYCNNFSSAKIWFYSLNLVDSCGCANCS